MYIFVFYLKYTLLHTGVATSLGEYQVLKCQIKIRGDLNVLIAFIIDIKSSLNTTEKKLRE